MRGIIITEVKSMYIYMCVCVCVCVTYGLGRYHPASRRHIAIHHFHYPLPWTPSPHPAINYFEFRWRQQALYQGSFSGHPRKLFVRFSSRIMSGKDFSREFSIYKPKYILGTFHLKVCGGGGGGGGGGEEERKLYANSTPPLQKPICWWNHIGADEKYTYPFHKN